MGGYLKCNKDYSIELSLQIKNRRGICVASTKKTLSKTNGNWSAFALDIEKNTSEIPLNQTYHIHGSYKLLTNQNNSVASLIGLQYGVITEYKEKENYFNIYKEKTYLYKPDIYYLPFNEITDYKITSSNKYSISEGDSVVFKSCNRCARYLPIDAHDERNSLSFSNHCKTKAPCTHKAFSNYQVESDILDIPKDLNTYNTNSTYYLKTFYGFQLECRTCKKFTVNAPLNPLRNRDQHHEDSSRRRAIERLIIELTGIDPILNFREDNGIEFCDYLLEKFGWKCFACKKEIDSKTLVVDHTLPLFYLWPKDKTATALCQTCNSEKHDLFPGQYKKYTSLHLKDLSQITGIPLEILSLKQPIVNKKIVYLLTKNVIWLFDDFLQRKDYQKIKKGKRVADLIYKALNKTVSTEDISLVNLYHQKTGRYPTSITLH